MFKRFRSTAVATILAAGLATSCVDSDILLGNEFIPPGQEQNTSIDNSIKVRTSSFALDSVESDQAGSVFVGAYQSELFGRTNSQGLATYYPDVETFADQDKLFGKNPTLDSMRVSLQFFGYVGDTSHKMQISVHELKNLQLRSSETYYSNFDATGFYEEQPILEFQLSGQNDTVVDMWLPESFYSKLLLNDPEDPENPYFVDTVFTDRFNGLYFRVNNEPSIGQEGTIRQLMLTASMMELYYHNEADGDIEADTTQLDFYFVDQAWSVGNHFTTIQHDYSTANPSQGGIALEAIGNREILSDRALLQGMGGIGTLVEIDTALIADFKDRVLLDGYSSIAVHKATLNWKLLPQLTSESALTLEQIEAAAEQIGLYYDFQGLDFLKEYDPKYEEEYYAVNGTEYVSDLGGFLNRSQLNYSQDITSKMQYLLTKPEGEPYSDNGNYRVEMEMLPSWSERLHYNETVLGGSESLEYAPELEIVYTLLK